MIIAKTGAVTLPFIAAKSQRFRRLRVFGKDSQTDRQRTQRFALPGCHDE
jgi:hypothetical protein